MTHIISMQVENHQGVLVRIAGLFSGRAYNLESLTVGVTIDPEVSRITLVCSGDDNVIEQIKKQLNKLIDVIKITDMTNVQPKQRSEIFQIADVFRAKVMDVGIKSMMLEVTGSHEKIDDILSILQPYSILEIARSGLVAMERGKKVKK
jgi:acetolactate synthase-1/3 small subunit